MHVLKFGGTSVATPEAIRRLGDILRQRSEKLIVVVSALGGTTDVLLRCGAEAVSGNADYISTLRGLEDRHLTLVQALLPITQQSSLLSRVKKEFLELEELCQGVFLLGEFSPKTSDRIAGTGEYLSSIIIAEYLRTVGLPAAWKDAKTLIETDDRHTAAAVSPVRTRERLTAWYQAEESPLTIIPGFIAATAAGVPTTLGRGGSDYTAAIIAGALGAEALEIWTDVSGMMTADPRLVPGAKTIPQISYGEAMELSHFGAKVIYPPTIQPVMETNIPVWIKNTFAPADAGTVIQDIETPTGGIARGISTIRGISLLSLEGVGMVGIPGFSRRLFDALAAQQVNVILITQASSEHSICVGVAATDAARAKAAVDGVFDHELRTGRLEPLTVEPELAVLALVGENMKAHTGIAGRMFGALGRNGVNVRAIAQGSSERNISAVIAAPDVPKALNVLHDAFFETEYAVIHLFVAGVGNVGRKLLAQLHAQREYLQKHHRLQIRVTGIANSRRMLLDPQGIDLAHWETLLQDAPPAGAFIEQIAALNLRNSVFADITANADLALRYSHLLRHSISVVACNKVACSGSYEYYKELKNLSREYNASLRFETNVGAGLPVIGSLNDLLRSGDRVLRIEAVLSGTLNFVFNHYDGSRPFAAVVRQAQAEGYTEPDPRLDLSGTDVARKLLILARESGAALSMPDISIRPFLPQRCMEGSVEDFYTAMEGEEAHFRQLFEAALAAGKKLKFVARYSEGAATVGLEHIDAAHDFYHLYGKDNAVCFFTDRYAEQPLVIKGAGAGAEVTAAGVFADVVNSVVRSS